LVRDVEERLVLEAVGSVDVDLSRLIGDEPSVGVLVGDRETRRGGQPLRNRLDTDGRSLTDYTLN